MGKGIKFEHTIIPPREWARVGGSVPVYPGTDPWSGLTVRVDPAVQYFTPDQKPAAEEHNFLHGERGDRLAEAYADITRIRRLNEAHMIGVEIPLNLCAATATASGRVFVCVSGTPAAGFDYLSLVPGGKLFRIQNPVTASAYDTPLCSVANSEKILFGNSPESFVYDSDLGTSTVFTGIVLDAIPVGTGWLALTSLRNTVGTSSFRGPRQFKGSPTFPCQLRSVSSAGVIGSDTAPAFIANLMDTYSTDEQMKINFFKCANSDVVIFSSSFIGNRFVFGVSTDDGATWTDRLSGLPSPYPGGDVAASMEWDSINQVLVLVMNDSVNTKVYKSADLGVSWTLVSTLVSNATYPGAGSMCKIYDIRRSSSGLIFGISFLAQDYSGLEYSTIFVTQDSGESWSAVGAIEIQPGASFPTLGMCNGPFMIVGGAGNKTLVPNTPLLAVGTSR